MKNHILSLFKTYYLTNNNGIHQINTDRILGLILIRRK